MTILVNGELVLYGFVGDNYWDEGFTSREVIDALAEVGRDADITVRMNSGGGYVDDGIAIYNAFSQHKGKVKIIIDAMAASSASIIAMAGDERIMRKGAMMMIHDPSSVVWGTADDMEKAVKMLERHAANLAGIYAEVTGEDVDDIRADMKSELWMTADEAVDRGFATSANDNKARAAAAHDYRVYARAPDRLVALSSKKNWSHAEATPKAMASATAEHCPKKEKIPMTIGTAAAEAASKAAKDARNRIKVILDSEEARGREALARHLAFETEMDPEVAVTALKVSPQAVSKQSERPLSYTERRLNAAGLAQPSVSHLSSPKLGGDLVASMKRRHGVE